MGYFPRKIQVVNVPGSGVSDADAYSFAQAMDVDMRTMFGPDWGLSVAAEFCSLNNPPGAGSVPLDPGKYPIYIVSGLGPAGIGGQHFHSADQSYGIVWTGSVGSAWPEYVSHEGKETAVNPLNVFTTGPDGTYVCALEVCDACEHVPYYVTGPDGRTWPMEDHCLPAWFSPDGVAPFDRAGILTQPLVHQPGGRNPS